MMLRRSYSPVASALLVLVITMAAPVARSRASAAPAVAEAESLNSLSGIATNALVEAYAASGLDGATGPPFRLEPYVVTIHSEGTYVDVFFLSQTQVLAIPVIVDTRTGEAVWTDRATIAPPHEPQLSGVVLPSIVAGELIAA